MDPRFYKKQILKLKQKIVPVELLTEDLTELKEHLLMKLLLMEHLLKEHLLMKLLLMEHLLTEQMEKMERQLESLGKTAKTQLKVEMQLQKEKETQLQMAKMQEEKVETAKKEKQVQKKAKKETQVQKVETQLQKKA